MNYRNSSKTILVGVVILTAGLLLATSVGLTKENGKQHMHKHRDGDMKAKSFPESCPKDKFSKSMKHCWKNMRKLKSLLAEAKDTAQKEGAKNTLAKINEAMNLINKQCHSMKKMKMHWRMCEGKIVNDRCPIKGTPLENKKVPDKLTRNWKGKKVGFCCPGCPEKWDKLSDEERQKKLDAAITEPDKEKKKSNSE